jgi:ribosome maturation factor RimP
MQFSIDISKLPSQLNESTLNSENHALVLGALDEIALKVGSAEKLRARDWCFERESGATIFDVFLDCGAHDAAPDMNLCAAFHEELLNAPFVDNLADNTELRVGSAGADCALRRVADFAPFVGQAIELSLWGAASFVCKLASVNEAEGTIQVSEDLASKEPALKPVSVAQLKRARVLYFHEVSKKFRQKDSHKKRDFRPKKERLA